MSDMQIEFREVKKSYRKKGGEVAALRSLSWTIESGSIYGLLGPNGSGKTTAIKLLLDLSRADAGTIEVDGKLWGNRAEDFRRSLGYLPEERGVYKKVPAIDFLLYLAQLKGLSIHEAQLRAKALLEEFGLGEFAKSPLDSFSKGMSQKLQLISTILHKPTLLILDEPFSGLDPLNVRLVREVILRVAAEGTLLLLCTHRMDEAERLCDNILMLNKGNVVLSGRQQELREELGRSTIRLRSPRNLAELCSVAGSKETGEFQEISLAEGNGVSDLLAELARENIAVSELHITPASLEEVYIAALNSPD